MLCLSVCLHAQDLKGRVYECNDIAKMREYFIYKMEHDPEEMKKEKTPQQKQEERNNFKTFFSFFDITAKVVFKSKNKFSFKLDIDVAREIIVNDQGTKRKLSWGERAAISIAYKPMLSLLARGMREERTYMPSRSPLFHEDEITITMRPNGTLLEFNDQGFVILLHRTK